MMVKKIYSGEEALVSDELISSSDAVINAAIPASRAGMIIYTAGYKTAKQKSLDNKWISMTLGGSGGSGSAGADGKDGVTPLLQKSATAIQVSYDSGETYSDLVPLSELKGAKGDTGDEGDTGATGAKGEKGETGATGADGADGKSAYQIWLDAGNSGNEAAFLASLKGAKGDTGAAGAKGDKGDTGAAGKNGDSIASITFTKDESGNITGGTATLTDDTTIDITIE